MYTLWNLFCFSAWAMFVGGPVLVLVDAATDPVEFVCRWGLQAAQAAGLA